MRKSLVLVFVVIAGHASPARALDVRSELTVGREFVYLTNDLESELADGQLALGAGMTMVSDYVIERYGAQGLIEYRGDVVNAGVAATFGPRQDSRGWASLDPHASLHLTRGRWQVDLDGGILLRRLDAQVRRSRIELDQLQLHATIDITIDDRWRVGALGLYSFYDPDPAARALRDVDLGLVVTLAGRPERWAAGGLLARRFGKKVWVELGGAGVTYADGHGVAVVPRGGLRLGPWRGVTVGASAEVVVGVAQAVAEPVREIGGVLVEYER